MIGVPDVVEPLEHSVDGSWEPGESGIKQVNSKLLVEVGGSEQKPELEVYREESVSEAEALWTAVHWAREYQVPGVWKETILLEGNEWRLGGLYMMAQFELKERESDYLEYGETPYV